jgi:hypothetical protein
MTEGNKLRLPSIKFCCFGAHRFPGPPAFLNMQSFSSLSPTKFSTNKIFPTSGGKKNSIVSVLNLEVNSEFYFHLVEIQISSTIRIALKMYTHTFLNYACQKC